MDLNRLVQTFKAGVREHGEVWDAVLGRNAAASLEKLAALEDPRFPADLWVNAVYAFAVAYCHGVRDRKALLEALIPLYNGRIAAFAREARDMTSHEAEALIEAQCALFEQAKPELVRLWESRKRQELQP
ncbi:MAG: glycosyl transferase family 2, partial [Bacillota bacterium]